MLREHYIPLALSYLVALIGWLLADRVLRGVWPRDPVQAFPRPWKEFGIALLGTLGMLVLGQLWTRGIRLPEAGPAGPVLASLNQVLIFSPILVVVVARRHPWSTAWLPRGKFALRLLIGFLLASAAVGTYSLLRADSDAPWVLLGRIWRYPNLDEMVQVFLEDVAIAILFVRLAGAVGMKQATVVVACLFAAGHVPAMVAQGATWLDLAALLRDAGLGMAVIFVLQRSGDILWFWCVHFCLDMTQFERISGVGQVAA
jgi:hypothetical protein